MKVVHADRLAEYEERNERPTRGASPGQLYKLSIEDVKENDIMARAPDTINPKYGEFGIRRRIRGSQPFTILVEGNIGCGKSTFTSRFLADPLIFTLLEPLDEYRDVGGVNLLQKMYEDPNRYGYLFQHHALTVMSRRHALQTHLPTKVMERSIYSNRCFTEARRRAGLLEDVEAEVLKNCFDSYAAMEDLGADLIVYLRLPPEVALERVGQRSREAEDGISLTYLQGLHNVHEGWMLGQNLFLVPAPVLVLDARNSEEEVYQEFLRFIGEAHAPYTPRTEEGH